MTSATGFAKLPNLPPSDFPLGIPLLGRFFTKTSLAKQLEQVCVNAWAAVNELVGRCFDMA